MTRPSNITEVVRAVISLIPAASFHPNAPIHYEWHITCNSLSAAPFHPVIKLPSIFSPSSPPTLSHSHHPRSYPSFQVFSPSRSLSFSRSLRQLRYTDTSVRSPFLFSAQSMEWVWWIFTQMSSLRFPEKVEKIRFPHKSRDSVNVVILISFSSMRAMRTEMIEIACKTIFFHLQINLRLLTTTTSTHTHTHSLTIVYNIWTRQPDYDDEKLPSANKRSSFMESVISSRTREIERNECTSSPHSLIRASHVRHSSKSIANSSHSHPGERGGSQVAENWSQSSGIQATLKIIMSYN